MKKDQGLAEEFLLHEQMNETADYLARGRRFTDRSVEQLNDAWVTAFRALAREDRSLVRDLDDSGAELRLRELPLPEEAVREELKAIGQKIRQLGPDALSDEHREKIDAFLTNRDKPQN